MFSTVWKWVRRSTLTDWLIVLLTAVIAGTSYLQWHEIRAGGQDTHDLAVAAQRQADAAKLQLEEMKKQSTDTHDLAVAAKHQADAAKKSADTAHEALTRSQRPWLGAEGMKFLATPEISKTGDVFTVESQRELIVKNYGTSPALAVEISSRPFAPKITRETWNPRDPGAQLRKFGVSVCGIADAFRNTAKRNPQSFGGTLFPGQTYTYTSIGADFVEREVLKEQFIQWVGCLSYTDQFSERVHHTRFCYLAKAGELGPVNDCGANNDTN